MTLQMALTCMWRLLRALAALALSWVILVIALCGLGLLVLSLLP